MSNKFEYLRGVLRLVLDPDTLNVKIFVAEDLVGDFVFELDGDVLVADYDNGSWATKRVDNLGSMLPSRFVLAVEWAGKVLRKRVRVSYTSVLPPM